LTRFRELLLGYRDLELQPGWQITEMMCEHTYTFNDLKKAGKEQQTTQ
jgi:hypothetical protein